MQPIKSLIQTRTFSKILMSSYPKLNLHNLDIGNRNKDPSNNEITVYIKGFLSNGESPANFKPWLGTHHKVPNWNKLAIGWYWDCGSNNLFPVPVTLAYTWYKGSKLLNINPLFLATSLSVDLGIHVMGTLWQYIRTEERTTQLADDLASNLIELSNRYSNVRIVAHSLGCKLLLNALDKIPVDKYPKTMHLLAPAVVETSYTQTFTHFQNYAYPRSRMYVYYCKNDFMLDTLLCLIKGFPPVGAVGMARSFQGIKSINVESFFNDSWFVHRNYKHMFNLFVADENKPINHIYAFENVARNKQLNEHYNYQYPKQSPARIDANPEINDLDKGKEKEHPEFLDYFFFSKLFDK